MPMPNLLDVQLQSFGKLIHNDIVTGEPWDFSLDRVFQEIFPISDVNENFSFHMSPPSWASRGTRRRSASSET